MADNKKALSNKLKQLKKNITAEDRKCFCKETGISESTLVRYLQGKVHDVEVGIKMVDFFIKRIAGRSLRIKKVLGNEHI